MERNCIFCNKEVKEKNHKVCFECRIKMAKEVLKPSLKLVIDYKNRTYKVEKKEK